MRTNYALRKEGVCPHLFLPSQPPQHTCTGDVLSLHAAEHSNQSASDEYLSIEDKGDLEGVVCTR